MTSANDDGLEVRMGLIHKRRLRLVFLFALFLAVAGAVTFWIDTRHGITAVQARQNVETILSDVAGPDSCPRYQLVQYQRSGWNDGSCFFLIRADYSDIERIRRIAMARTQSDNDAKASRCSWDHSRMIQGKKNLPGIVPTPSWWLSQEADDTTWIGYPSEFLILSPKQGLIYVQKFTT